MLFISLLQIKSYRKFFLRPHDEIELLKKIMGNSMERAENKETEVFAAGKNGASRRKNEEVAVDVPEIPSFYHFLVDHARVPGPQGEYQPIFV